MSRLYWKVFLALWLSIMAFSLVNAWFHAYIIDQGRGMRTEQVLRESRAQPPRMRMLGRRPPGALLEPGPRGIIHRLLLSAFISALVSLLLARYLARPLESLSATSRALAEGDLGTRVGPPLTGRRDEFGDLARDFDEMASRLEQLQRANQTLLRDVSHELRSPLARLRVALEIARNRDASAVAGELDRIELESERLESLVDQVLDLLRETAGPAALKLASFDLCELLEDLREVVSYELPEGVELRLECPSSLPLTADRELLWRAIENLLRNAVLHSGGAGEVCLRAQPGPGGQVQVSVLDQGPGVPAASLQRIFDPFYRVDAARARNGGGHGLGLAIAAAAVRRHGGSIEARNRPVGGLEILVLLPPA